MAIQLEKGQRINLEKDNGAKLTNFCVGCNWGAIVVERTGFFGFGARKEELDVDVDLSCRSSGTTRGHFIFPIV